MATTMIMLRLPQPSLPVAGSCPAIASRRPWAMASSWTSPRPNWWKFPTRRRSRPKRRRRKPRRRQRRKKLRRRRRKRRQRQKQRRPRKMRKATTGRRPRRPRRRMQRPLLRTDLEPRPRPLPRRMAMPLPLPLPPLIRRTIRSPRTRTKAVQPMTQPRRSRRRARTSRPRTRRTSLPPIKRRWSSISSQPRCGSVCTRMGLSSPLVFPTSPSSKIHRPTPTSS
mmetsp:Transcript_8654/g.20386  ORF Transcript_8654/g.20386 Transcript_8654/m.20386 type:complete len:224 (+) Transcript_8654:1434-2105(+)